MSEKKLFGFMSLEGMLLLFLGFCILILPRLTSISYATMTGISFIIYGIFKFVCSILDRDLFQNFVCHMLLGIMLFVLGILLQIPRINILWLIAFVGIYFVLEAVTSSAFVARVREIARFWLCKPFVLFVLLLAGLYILVKLPVIAFSTVAVITGVCFALKGACKKALGIANAYVDTYAVNKNGGAYGEGRYSGRNNNI